MLATISSAGADVLASQGEAMHEKRESSRQSHSCVYHSDVEFGPTDVSLLVRAQKDDAARREFFDLYKDACYTFLKKLRLDRSAANDHVGDVWQKLAEGKLLHTYQPGKGRFRFYLKQTLRHLAWDGKKLPPNPPQPLGDGQFPAGTPSPLAVVERQDAPEYKCRGQVLLAEALAGLIAKAEENDRKGKESTRHVEALRQNLDLARRMACGEGSPRIAEATGLTKHAVRARARLVRLKLDAEMRKILYGRFKKALKPTDREDQDEFELRIQLKVDDEIVFIQEALDQL